MTIDRITVARIGAVGLAFVAGLAGAQHLMAVQKLQPGQYLLKEIGAPAGRSLCLADPTRVLQIQHGDARCNRTVIDNRPTELTVTYLCPGAGSGRTTMTVRDATSFRLQTQGLAGGAPFDFDLEARRTGDC